MAFEEVTYASVILTRFRSPPETPRMKSLPTLCVFQLEVEKICMRAPDHCIDCMAETKDCHDDVSQMFRVHLGKQLVRGRSSQCFSGRR